MGAIAGGGVALWFGDSDSSLAMPLMLLAGILGGMAWAAIPAFLRTRFNTNEILVTLMLVYIAQLMLSWLVHGPWRDPQGQNYPQSQGFGDAETMSVADRRNPRDLGHRLCPGARAVCLGVLAEDVRRLPHAGGWPGTRRRRLCRLLARSAISGLR